MEKMTRDMIKKMNWEIGNRIATLRISANLQQTKVVTELQLKGIDITNKSLSNYENGRCTIPYCVLVYLAQIYHADLNFIITGKKTAITYSNTELHKMAHSSKEISRFFETLLSQSEFDDDINNV
jgi:transcriptional regulator with XRE-family HTH domain